MSVIRRCSAVLLAGVFVVSSSGLLMARDRDDKCEARVHKAERNLQKAINRHGEHSRQAEQKRRELDQARDRCGHDRDHDRH